MKRWAFFAAIWLGLSLGLAPPLLAQFSPSGVSVPITVTTSSVAYNLPPGPTVRIDNSGSSDAFVTFGTGQSVSTSTTTGDRIAAGGWVQYSTSGTTWIAVIGSGSTTIRVTPGSGTVPGALAGGVGACSDGNPCSPLTVTINSATFKQAPNFSTGELELANNIAGQNVLTLYNAATGGFSALTFRGTDVQANGPCENMAIGKSNAAYANFGDYIEISGCFDGIVEAVVPPDFTINQTGLVGGVTTVHKNFVLGGSTSKWVWFEPNSGLQTMMFDPIGGTSQFNGTVQIGAGGSSPTQVGTLDVYGAATVGSATNNRTGEATGTFNIDDATPVFNFIKNTVRSATLSYSATPTRVTMSDATGSKAISEWYMDGSGTFATDFLFLANGQIDATAKVLMSPTSTDTVNDGNDTLVIQRPNFAQMRIYGPDNAVNGFLQVNKSGNSNSLGGTAAGLQISTQSAHPLSFGTNGHLGLVFDTSTVPVATFQGNIVAPAVINYTGAVKSTPSTGGTVTYAATQRLAIIVPAGTLATLTITLPACAAGNDGDERSWLTSQILTSITVGASSGSVVGGVTTAAVGSGHSYHCYGADTAWYQMD